MGAAIGFIGMGNMAYGIFSGMLKANLVGDDKLKVFAFDANAAQKQKIDNTDAEWCESAQSVVDNSDYVFLCVKPQNLDDLLKSVEISSQKVIVSICAGISGEYIKKRTNQNAKVILVMPNTPLMLGEGASALARCSGVLDEEFSLIMSIFESCGIAREIDESKMKEIIAINGSSPAFTYLFAKTFADYASSVDIDSDAALALFAQTLIGSAKMITDSGSSIDELIKMVSSPGGTTLAGLSKLYENGFENAVVECCKACTQRAYELSAE